MDFKEGKLNYPIGELIPGPFGEMEGNKSKSTQENEKKKSNIRANTKTEQYKNETSSLKKKTERI